MSRPLPDWIFPVAYFGAVILIVVALWAIGDGRGPGSFRSEVQGARHLIADEQRLRKSGQLTDEQKASIQSALDSLDPAAVERAER